MDFIRIIKRYTILQHKIKIKTELCELRPLNSTQKKERVGWLEVLQYELTNERAPHMQ